MVRKGQDLRTEVLQELGIAQPGMESNETVREEGRVVWALTVMPKECEIDPLGNRKKGKA
jgi:hypothetical protein